MRILMMLVVSLMFLFPVNSHAITESGGGEARSVSLYGKQADGTLTPILVGATGVVSTNSGWTDSGTNVILTTSTDNVGIGTSLPRTSMDIFANNSSATLTDLTQNVTKANLLIGYTRTAEHYTPGLFWYANNNNPTKPKAGIFLQDNNAGISMLLGTSNTYSTGITNTALVIDQAGNVGIGTSIPSTTFEVQQGGTVDATKGIGLANDNQKWRMWIDSSADLNIRDATANENKVTFNNGSGGFTKFNTNVGINTAVASGLLTVSNGTLQVTGSSQIAPSGGAGVEVAYIGTTGFVIAFNRTTGAYAPFSTGGSTTTIQSNGTTRMYMPSTGNVGIGTTIPGGALTVINGNVGIGTWNPRSIFEVDITTGTSQVTIDGTTGGCLMIQDTDGAGWTECDVLNGVMSCSTDADGICD